MEYKLKCPRCGYQYKVVTIEPAVWEICPICGLSKPIEEFIWDK